MSKIFGFVILASLSATASAMETLPQRLVTCEEMASGHWEVESRYQAQFQSLVDKDLEYLKKLQEEAVPEYLSLRERARKDLAGGQSDFPFAPHRVIVERIAKDSKQRQSRKFGKKYAAELESIHQKALQLLRDGDPPYKATIRFVMFEYLPMLDKILVERWPDPQLLNPYHRHHAEHLVEKFLAGAPDYFIFFSFEYTNDMFFVDTRPALMNLVGINLKGVDDESESPPFGDKHYMLISEFAWHDWGHAEYTAFRDLIYLLSGGKPIERVVWEWEVTRRKVKAVVDQVKARDQSLGEAMEQIEFEFLRERGFQINLTLFKQELETPKWIEVLQRKLQAGFYAHGDPADLQKFKRLEEARITLLRAVERLREEAQLAWICAVGCRSGVEGLPPVPAQITYTPALGYTNTARLDYVEFASSMKAVVHSRNNDAVVDIDELISAQVNPTKASPFNKNVVEKIAHLLWLRDNLGTVSLLGKGDHVRSIRVLATKQIVVVGKSGRIAPLDHVSYSLPDRISVPQIPNLEIFKINQVLGTEERGESMAFTIRQPNEVMTGSMSLEQDRVTGHYTAHITTIDGKKRTLPLVQLRIDPLNDKAKDL